MYFNFKKKKMSKIQKYVNMPMEGSEPTTHNVPHRGQKEQ